MNYSYLKEVYQVDSNIEKKKTKKKKQPEYSEEPLNEQSYQEKGTLKTPFERQLETPKPNIVKQNIQPYLDDELEKYFDVKQSNSVNMNYTPIENDNDSYIDQQFSRIQSNKNNVDYNYDRYTPPSIGYYNSRYLNDKKDDSMNRDDNGVINDIDKNESNIDDKKYNEIENQSHDIFFKNFINIGLFIFIGILIIFLCEQITEIAIAIGMKRTVSILEPYLRKKQ